ncbi:hypothetical protein PybrP1_008508 [[Pythium] brassicae (nom. inval.)]|nr:hypothetical protein PybrP1_008508 [[Pythium] brassicae (nom. inval.)]
MRSAASIRTLLWRRHAAVLSGSRAVLLGARRGFAALPDGVEELAMPALSPTMTAGSLARWLKTEGEQLRAGDVLCQIETDKAVVDYEMQDDAVLAVVALPEGAADIPVGAVLAYTVPDVEMYESLAASGALKALKDAPVSASAAPAVPAPEAAAAATAAPVETPAAHGARQPLIKFLGKRSLLAAAPAAATAPATASAPAAAAAAAPAAAAPASGDDFTDVALSNMRKIIAKRLTASKVTAPHQYASIECEIDSIMALRQTLKSAHSVKVSVNDFILKAVALALRDVPEANCHFDAATKSVQPNPSVDISVAVATAAGLITPIVPGVDALGLSGVNRVFMELVARARQNKLKPEEFQGGSFTISNLGGFGVDNFTAVINGQACILAVGRGRKEVLPPRSLENGAEPRLATLMNVTLSHDRRVVDDVVSGQFLQVFKRYMENPELMVL